MTESQLQSKLQSLREKWRGKVPKSNSDPDFWKFKCDSCIATRLKSMIARKEFITEADTSEIAQMIFG